ncbi:TonB-dependent receptor [Aurantiacibacter flavus]|uniref:TonB-dependent receptor n=1 Tax=Aurantiacibacter flavus TaxID=3145232 RepID=A0ABV0D048_9SPHN
MSSGQHSRNLFAGVALAALLLPATAATAQSSDATGENNDVIVVTGVLTPQSPDSVAVTSIDDSVIEAAVPMSAADILKNVPGVYVNSSLGEVRNVVYSRGISANSTDAAAGYYYVSLQEDGMPVSNVTFNNFGPDFFYRSDISLASVEALRGGTAVVTGPNAPGGIFNYISKNGETHPGVEVRARVGLEGDGRNPYYRADAYVGGQIGDSDLFYSLSGFYRQNRGRADPGYPANRGGQIKGNLVWDYGSGSLKATAKYLDDHNTWNEFLPARNFDDPQLIEGFDRYDSFLVPAAPHEFVTNLGAPVQEWNGRQAAHSKSLALNLDWEQRFGDGWTIRNNARFANNTSDWNSSALVFPVQLTDFLTNIFINAGLDGTYSYRDPRTGNLLAEMVKSGATRTVTANNLPNQQGLENRVLTQVAFNFHPETTEIMDQLTVSKEFDRGSLTVGGYFAHADVEQYGGGAGIGLATLEDQPQMLDITLETPGGDIKQVTSPAGFTGIGQRIAGTPFRGEQTQFSLFGGASYELTPELILEGAVRYERIAYSGSNDVQVANPQSSDPQYGGLDGDPDTLFDNFAVTYNTPFNYDFDLDYVSFSGAVTYEVSPDASVYVRYSQGKKAPDFGFFTTYDTLDELNNLVPMPQKIQQLEAGLRLNLADLRLSAIPFFSKLSNVGTQQIGTRADGSTYVPPVLFSTTETVGIELEADWDITRDLNLYSAITLQDAQSKGFAVYVFNAPGESDDTITTVPDGDADNTPRIMTSSTLRYSPGERFTAFATWRYLGERAANRYNAFYFPGYHTVDIGTNFNVSENFTLGANINNLFNSAGVSSFAPAGTLLGALDRQNLTPEAVAADPDQPFNVILSEPRAFFLTASFKM